MSKNGKKKHMRSLKLIANFIDGYAEGWHFAVGECFKDELDIKYVDRVIKGKKIKKWTQGPYFCFAEGHIIYDIPKEYHFQNESCKVCSVIRATPNQLDGNGKFIHGFVTFKLSQLIGNWDSYETIGQYNLTQNAFVDFLQTGNLNKEG